MERYKILVVDDESRMRKLVSDFLVKSQYQVVEAENGREALDVFFAENDIDLVILDVMMPRMDGWQACREIRAVSKVPIIMLTAKAMRGTNFWDLSWGWMNIFPNPSARKFLWRGWRRSFAEPDRRRR